MVKLYHGTTEEKCKAILENGFRYHSVVWTCSDPDMMYFYNQDMVEKEYALTPQAARERCFELAVQSAFSTAAITDSLSRNLFVLEMQIPDSHLSAILRDESTGDWDGISVCVPSDVLNHFSCNVYGAPDCYSPKLAALCIASLANREYLSKIRLTELEREVIYQINDVAIESFLSITAEFLTRPKLVQLHHDIRTGQVQQMEGCAGIQQEGGPFAKGNVSKPSLREQLRDKVQEIRSQPFLEERSKGGEVR